MEASTLERLPVERGAARLLMAAVGVAGAIGVVAHDFGVLGLGYLLALVLVVVTTWGLAVRGSSRARQVRLERELAAVSEQLRRESRMRREAEAQALSALKTRAAFLAAMSHELRTPWKPAPPGTSAPRSLRTLIRRLHHQTRPHGAEFEYRSMETEVLGFCLEAAASAPLPQLVSDLIWQPMGAAHPASFGLDPEGATIADGALSATLPDLARFGLIFAQEGAANGRQIVPADWVAQTRQGDASRFPARYRVDRPNGAYRNQFWIEDTARPFTLALEVYGQMIFIDPARYFVGVKLSTWPMALNPALRLQTQCLMHSLARACGPQAN